MGKKSFQVFKTSRACQSSFAKITMRTRQQNLLTKFREASMSLFSNNKQLGNATASFLRINFFHVNVSYLNAHDLFQSRQIVCVRSRFQFQFQWWNLCCQFFGSIEDEEFSIFRTSWGHFSSDILLQNCRTFDIYCDMNENRILAWSFRCKSLQKNVSLTSFKAEGQRSEKSCC